MSPRVETYPAFWRALARAAMLLVGLVGLASSRCRIATIATFNVAKDTPQLVTHGVVDGQPVWVLLDSGSFTSLISRSAVPLLGLRMTGMSTIRLFGLGGESTVNSSLIDTLRVGTYKATHVRLPVSGELNPIAVILGEDVLGSHSIEFDVRHGEVRTLNISGCAPPQLPYWAKSFSMADLIGSPQQSKSVRVRALINGHPVMAQLDTGSSVSLLARSIADAAGIAYENSKTEVKGIGRGLLTTWIGEVQSFQLGDESINNTQLRLAQLGKFQTIVKVGSRIAKPIGNSPELLLGMDFLRAHHVLVDNSTGKFVFTYESGPVFQTGAETGESSSRREDSSGPLSP